MQGYFLIGGPKFAQALLGCLGISSQLAPKSCHETKSLTMCLNRYFKLSGTTKSYDCKKQYSDTVLHPMTCRQQNTLDAYTPPSPSPIPFVCSCLHILYGAGISPDWTIREWDPKRSIEIRRNAERWYAILLCSWLFQTMHWIPPQIRDL